MTTTDKAAKLAIYSIDKLDLYQEDLSKLKELLHILCSTRHVDFSIRPSLLLCGVTTLETVKDYAAVLSHLHGIVVKQPEKAWKSNGAFWWDELLTPRIHVTKYASPERDRPDAHGAYPDYLHTVTLGFPSLAEMENTANHLAESKLVKALGLRTNEKRTESKVELKIWGMPPGLLDVLVKRG